MARRVYEEDSFGEDLEELPLQRSRRLRGGYEPTGAKSRKRRLSCPELLVDSDDPATAYSTARVSHARTPTTKYFTSSPTSFTAAARATPAFESPSVEELSAEGGSASPADDAASNSPRYTSNDSKVVEVVEFMKHLCNPGHRFEPQDVKPLDLHAKKQKCGVCGKGRFRSRKCCSFCGLQVHSHCEANAPIPCLVSIPMQDIEKPNVWDCVEETGVRTKVPAILKKLFHELQKVERIQEPQMYFPPSKYDEDQAEIKKWISILSRSAVCVLTRVPTSVLTGCVLKFLLDVRSEIVSPEEENALLKVRQKLLLDLEGSSERERRARETTIDSLLETTLGRRMRSWTISRRHTLAAVILHLRTIIANNAMTKDEVLKVFRPVIPAIDTFFAADNHFWESQLTSLRRP